MTPCKLIQISDVHLSRKKAYTYPNWRASLAYIESVRPDMVINTGDLVLETPEDIADLQFALAEMKLISSPMHIIPGDHDIGGPPPQPILRADVPWLERYMITPERLDQYRALAGVDYWATFLGDWQIIGLNVSLFSSNYQSEHDQWAFLEAQLEHDNDRPTALFMHKPPCLASFAEAGETSHSIPQEARVRLGELVRRHPVRLIASGHRHLYRTYTSCGVCIVNAPSLMADTHGTWAVDGVFRNGIVEYTFDGESVTFQLIEPPGVEFLQVPDGYTHLWPELSPDESLA